MRALSFPLAGAFAAALSLSTGPALPTAQQPADDALRAQFLARVSWYVELHRQLEGPLPRLHVTPDPGEIIAAQAALARAIRHARPDAQQGEIFLPDVAALIRRIVVTTLVEKGITDMLQTVEDENTVVLSVRVNADYPAGASISMMPPCLLLALPQLPPELEYRFAGRHLILWDVHAGIIADYVPNVLREPTTAVDFFGRVTCVS